MEQRLCPWRKEEALSATVVRTSRSGHRIMAVASWENANMDKVWRLPFLEGHIVPLFVVGNVGQHHFSKAHLGASKSHKKQFYLCQQDSSLRSHSFANVTSIFSGFRSPHGTSHLELHLNETGQLL